MKKGFFLSVLAFAFLGLLLCCSARAQTWRELLDQADSLYPAAAYDSAIEAGKLADLSLVDGNPIEDITVLEQYQEKITMIMQGGRFYKNLL